MTINKWHIILVSFILTTVMCNSMGVSFAAGENQNRIIVDLSVTKAVNPWILGNNALGYDPCSFEHYKGCTNRGTISNFGLGQWDPQNRLPNPELVALARSMKISVLRFPGGCGTHHYNWKASVGPLEKRPLFQFGLDEYLAVCHSIGAEPLITMSYFTGTDEDLVDMVEYLNYPLGKGNPNAGVNWAEERARNGHPAPYNVKYFEFGNEVYHGNHTTIPKVDPKVYARRYLCVQDKCRRIDPSIQIGIVCQGWSPGMTSWDRRIAEIVLTRMDFAIMHVYPVGYRSHKGKASLETLNAALASTGMIKDNLEKFSLQLKGFAGRFVPLAITEYNGDFIQEQPLPYRHSLVNALCNALMLQAFLYTDVPILCANYWQFSNSYWGLVYTADQRGQSCLYFKRPNYYVFDLFANHFGSYLTQACVSSPKTILPDTQEFRFEIPRKKSNQVSQFKTSFSLPANRSLSIAASMNPEKSRLFLIVVNKDLQKATSATIGLRSIPFSPHCSYWILDGPAVDSTNEGQIERVKITQGKVDLGTPRSQFTFTFAPHSITALEMGLQ